jgi:hypothetical protein
MGMTIQQTHYPWRKKVATETLRRSDPHRSFESTDAPTDLFLGQNGLALHLLSSWK